MNDSAFDMTVLKSNRMTVQNIYIKKILVICLIICLIIVGHQVNNY